MTGAGLRTCGASHPIPSISSKNEDEDKGGLVQHLRAGKEVRSRHVGKRESEPTGETRWRGSRALTRGQSAVLGLFPAPLSSMWAGEDKTGVGFELRFSSE